MASSVRLLQQIFSGLNGLNNAGLNSTAASTNGTAVPTPTSPPLPTDLNSLINFLVSFSALRDWLKLIVIGGIIETVRRLAFSAWAKFVASFWITACIEEEDEAFDWLMLWLSKQPAYGQARELQISTRSFGLNSTAILVDGEEEDSAAVLSGSRKLAYLPSLSTTYTMWYKRRWMQITRTTQNTGYYGRKEETLTLSIFTRSHKPLNEILLLAKKEYKATQENTISIYISDSSNDWRHVTSRPKRALRSIVLDPGIKDLLMDDARDFLESKSWYADRGIPFRRGYLLYGAPGSGKTSVIHALAGELGLDVYVISLSRAGLDDTALNELISELPEKCIALMEDIDAAFQAASINRDASAPPALAPSDDAAAVPKGATAPPPGTTPPPSAPSSRISLSGLLNALDGVGAQEGRILFATTNKYTSLDAALCRPGRMDLHVEFKLASRFQARELFKCFYLPGEEPKDTLAHSTEEKLSDSGYASPTGSSTPIEVVDLIDLSLSDEKKTSVSLTVIPPSPPSSEPPPLYTGDSHRRRAPVLSRSQVLTLAHRFAENLPEREFSMASLQGYLMAYKTRPVEAAKEVGAWVIKEQAEKEAKGGASPTAAVVQVTKAAEEKEAVVPTSAPGEVAALVPTS